MLTNYLNVHNEYVCSLRVGMNNDCIDVDDDANGYSDGMMMMMIIIMVYICFCVIIYHIERSCDTFVMLCNT